jgi:dephospho-CoA kinase
MRLSPAVKRHFKQWLLDHKEFPIVIYEAAILFESGNYKDFDNNGYSAIRIENSRVIERDKTTRDQVLGRINSQWTDEQRVSKVILLLKILSM